MLSCAYKHATQLCFTLLLTEAEKQQQAAGQQGQQGQEDPSLAARQHGRAVESSAVLQHLGVALQSRQYEVRCTALKVQLKHVQAARHALRMTCMLRRLLLAHLAAEPHHKAQRRTLHLLALLPPTAAADGAAQNAALAAPAPGPEHEFAAVMRWATAAADSRVKQHAIRCLGPLLRQLSQGGLSPAAFQAAGQLLGLAADCGQPVQLPELRLAAAEALAASGMLVLEPLQSEQAASTAAGAWEALLPLLEDEDEAVRAVASSAAAAEIDAFQGAASSSSGAGAGQPAAPGSAEAVAPSEERTLRRLFPALAARFGPHPALLSLLCRLCCSAAAAAAGVPGGAFAGAAEAGRPASAAVAAAAAAASGKIFDPEPDNMHEEPVLLAQVHGRSLLPQRAVPTGRAIQEQQGCAALQHACWIVHLGS